MTWPGLTPPYGALLVDPPWRYHAMGLRPRGMACLVYGQDQEAG